MPSCLCPWNFEHAFVSSAGATPKRLPKLSKNYTDRVLPKIKMIIAKTKKITNRILAISRAEPAIRVNPNSAATIAIIKNVAAHRNIAPSPPAGRQALFRPIHFSTYLPIFSMCCPVSDRSFPAPLIALHPNSEVIKIRTSKPNKVSFFILFSFLAERLFLRFKHFLLLYYISIVFFNRNINKIDQRLIIKRFLQETYRTRRFQILL